MHNVESREEQLKKENAEIKKILKHVSVVGEEIFTIRQKARAFSHRANMQHSAEVERKEKRC